MQKLIKICSVLGLVVFLGCSTDFDQLENPNDLTPEKANINFLFNQVQLSFRNFYGANFFFGAQMTRMSPYTAGNNYNNGYNGNTFNGIWNAAYAELLPDINALIELGSAKNFDKHIGMSKVLQAYTLFTLVDIFGDVPYTEALQGTDIISPKVDGGQSIYNIAIGILDEAIELLNNNLAPTPSIDLYYKGDVKKWITLAKTLKLRAYNNIRLVDEATSKAKITELLNENDLIDQASEDFVYQFGTNRENPNNRHPGYNDHYETGDGQYLSNYYMWLFYGDKAVADPRIRFYFFRQELDMTDPAIVNVNTLSNCGPLFPPAHFPANMPFCLSLSNGYWGRDHMNNSGTPPDGRLRTMVGVYPAGGKFDDEQGGQVKNSGTDGGLGAGIWPIMLASFVDFIKAEAALTLGAPGDARALLSSGVEKSIDKVYGFATLIDKDLDKVVGKDLSGNPITARQAYLPGDEEKQEYISEVLRLYDEAGSVDAKLNVIIKEYYLAAWGNGMEVYNNLRRTGKPDNLQPGINPNPGEFIRSAIYPNNFVQLNSNAVQKAPTVQVFWDKLPPGSIK